MLLLLLVTLSLSAAGSEEGGYVVLALDAPEPVLDVSVGRHVEDIAAGELTDVAHLDLVRVAQYGRAVGQRYLHRGELVLPRAVTRWELHHWQPRAHHAAAS